MDIELLRTFIEVYRCRHFGHAADRLYITQSAVSARIRQLESSLGCVLFNRERKKVVPTADGERFLAHAEDILQRWHKARDDMSGESGGVPFGVGAAPAIWDAVALNWLQDFLVTHPDCLVRTESRHRDALMQRLLEGVLDLVFVLETPRAADIEYRQAGELRLVLASTERGASFEQAVFSNYIALEWGAAFGAAQNEWLGKSPALRMDSPVTALAWLERHGGSAYLAEEVVTRRADLLHAVNDAPRFTREIHAAFAPRSERREVIEAFIERAKNEKPG